MKLFPKDMDVILRKYCTGKNRGSGTLSLKFIRNQNLYQLQYLTILLSSQGHKNPQGQNFWNLNFLFLKRQVYINIIRTKINLGSHHLRMKLSYNETVDKIVSISIKTWQKCNFMFFGNLYLTFALV